MTYTRIAFFFCFTALVFSCQKEIAEATTGPTAQQMEASNNKSLFDAFYEVNFKEDFIIPPTDDGTARNTRPSEEEWSVRRAASSRDMQSLEQTFTESKLKVENFYQRNDGVDYVSTIHFVSLKYLRRYLLLDDNAENRQHALDLLRILIATKSIDLDVLVDTYNYTKDLMDDTERGHAFAYLADRYEQDIAMVRERVPELMERYHESEGNEQKKYLLSGKNMERRSHACAYARQKLPNLLKN